MLLRQLVFPFIRSSKIATIGRMLLRQLIFPFVWYRGFVFIGHFCVVRVAIYLSDRMLVSGYHGAVFEATLPLDQDRW